jgi:microcystin-dependent protein
MSVNQFLPFATGTGANVLTPSAYAALTALVAQGFQSGIAPSQQVNTPLRQATFVAAAVAQLITDSGIDALDDGNLTNFKTYLSQAIAFPRGTVMMYPSSTPPSGCLSLNGAAISRTAYSFLFGLFGTTFGAGDGSTTFNLPDCRNRMPVGSGSLYTLGASGGSASVTLSSANLPPHTHGFSGTTGSTDLSGTFYASNRSGPGPTGSFYDAGGRANSSLSGGGLSGDIIQYGLGGNHAHSFGGSTDSGPGSATAFTTLPPYLALNYVIKY